MDPEDTAIIVDICDQQLVLHQSRKSFNCGSTLWSAGLVLARYLEQERSMFDKGKLTLRVLELGAGLGLAGIVCALHGGCQEVVLTDLASVLPYLQKNARFIPGVRVQEFPWGEPPEEYDLSAPYDLVLAADCIYDVAQVAPFLHALSAVAGPKTTILIGNEERDKVLQAHFVATLGEHFTVKSIKRKKLCGLEGYHELVQVWACKKKRCKGELSGSQPQSLPDGSANEENSDEEKRSKMVAEGEAAADEGGK